MVLVNILNKMVLKQLMIQMMVNLVFQELVIFDFYYIDENVYVLNIVYFFSFLDVLILVIDDHDEYDDQDQQ